MLTRDAAWAARLARALSAGIVWVNCSQPCFCQAPWGGTRQSGTGRDDGQAGFDGSGPARRRPAPLARMPCGWREHNPSRTRARARTHTHTQ